MVRISTPSHRMQPRLWFVEPAEQLHHGGLAGSVEPDQTDRLAGRQPARHAPQHPRELLVIAEPDIIELDAVGQLADLAGAGAGDRAGMSHRQVVVEHEKAPVSGRHAAGHRSYRGLQGHDRGEQDRDITDRQPLVCREVGGGGRAAQGDQPGQRSDGQLNPGGRTVHRGLDPVGAAQLAQHPADQVIAEAEQPDFLRRPNVDGQVAVEDESPEIHRRLHEHAGAQSGQPQLEQAGRHRRRCHHQY